MESLRESQTSHLLVVGDARVLSFLKSESVHLVVTSPPYWTLKKYPEDVRQLGAIADYESFLEELRRVWLECYRVLVPGGRLVCIVGDVCLARRRFGRHVVVPLHADVQVQCRKLGFDNLNPIFWLKIANARLEMERPTSFLGKPYEPNAIIKNDVEYILMQRKPGGYRKPTESQRRESRIAKEDFAQWFQQVWKIPGASTRTHPAPFPLEVATRLIRMFSFEGDMVLDPFMGTGTTNVAAALSGRNSIGVEIMENYVRLAETRLAKEAASLFASVKVVSADSLKSSGEAIQGARA
ncbi:MAG: DNA-methyltransferase [Nitrospinota bacterium]